MNLPLALRYALESGDCVLFLGAGLGYSMTRPNGDPAPDGKGLARELVEHFDLGTSSTDLAKVSKLVELRHSRQELDTFVKRALANLEPGDSVKWLTTFRWRAIFTTNYDRGIERAYELNPAALQKCVPVSATSDMQYTDPRVEVPVYHLHGTPFGPSTSPIVMTQTDYARYQDKRRMLWNRLRNEFATSTFLYIGYSGNDPNWQLVLDEVRREFYPSEMPLGYRLDPYAEDIDIEIFTDLRLHTLVGNLDDLRDTADRAIGNFRPDIDIISRNKGRVPAHLQDPFEKQPAMVLRLLDSWEYANAPDLAPGPNVRQFLNGERPNWSLIDSGRKFSRDIETEIWDKIEEFATQPTARSIAVSLVAPAGYGVTTTLMSLAMRIVKSNIGPVFMLRDGQQVLEGDVQFAASLFPGIPSSSLLIKAASMPPHSL